MSDTEIDRVSLFSKDSNIVNGKITTPSHLKLAGYVKMDIWSEGKVFVADTGVVHGNISAASVQIHGKVTGEIRVTGTVKVDANAEVNGVIFAKRLSIEEGAICNFVLKIGHEVSTLKGAPANTPVPDSVEKNGSPSLLSNYLGKYKSRKTSPELSKNGDGSGNRLDSQFVDEGENRVGKISDRDSKKDRGSLKKSDKMTDVILADDDDEHVEKPVHKKMETEKTKSDKLMEKPDQDIPEGSDKPTNGKSKQSKERDWIDRFW